MRNDVFFGPESSETKGAPRRESPSDDLGDKCFPGQCLTESSFKSHRQTCTTVYSQIPDWQHLEKTNVCFA